MAVFIGGINGTSSSFTAKEIMNMGRFSKERNGNRVSITYEDPFYMIKVLRDNKIYNYEYTTFKEAKRKFNDIYKSL